MKDNKIVVLVVAALFVGLMTGILGPKLFGRKPAVSTVSGPAPGQLPPQAPGTNYTLKISELKRRLETNPNDVGLLVQLGNTYFDSHMYPESIEAYEKSLALKPGNPNVLTDLGVMYRRNGQPEEAVKRFRMAAEADPTHPQSRMNLGVVLFYDLQDAIGARQALEGLLSIYPQGPNADQARLLMAEIDKMTGGQ
ncbi:MAG: tetratricopeptide repeat protein [bacterium]|nr:tetratricopeptide repeat protein [bacterium]